MVRKGEVQSAGKDAEAAFPAEHARNINPAFSSERRDCVRCVTRVGGRARSAAPPRQRRALLRSRAGTAPPRARPIARSPPTHRRPPQRGASARAARCSSCAGAGSGRRCWRLPPCRCEAAPRAAANSWVGGASALAPAETGTQAPQLCGCTAAAPQSARALNPGAAPQVVAPLAVRHQRHLKEVPLPVVRASGAAARPWAGAVSAVPDPPSCDDLSGDLVNGEGPGPQRGLRLAGATHVHTGRLMRGPPKGRTGCLSSRGFAALSVPSLRRQRVGTGARGRGGAVER
jgi:hypothetical protein